MLQYVPFVCIYSMDGIVTKECYVHAITTILENY